ncbi:metallophosphatase family protein [Methanofollis aquaemaris]|uniref:Metallophosphatase family protein n=1 Tax=Methanofollis aquaemaris TaxID=126734 RepID=A0A8A3S6Z8_9EURY|nr:metallophosphoesterase family protein [Methanofollis aquaemaris]QSZ67915.1 metallophosphatase family protein [Methanofollis aquaemaris]
MATLIFSDVHADAPALLSVHALLKDPAFHAYFGEIDRAVNLGDLLGRGYAPVETLAAVQQFGQEMPLLSVVGNHDHAFLHGIPVSGSDAASLAAHRALEGSLLLEVVRNLPEEAVLDATLFVHGGPLRAGDALTDRPFWQRLSARAGPSCAGYHYTPGMAFAELERRGLSHLCCGHQHTPLCCQKRGEEIVPHPLILKPIPGLPLGGATVALDAPSILRVGACCGAHPEFAVTDFFRFWFLQRW